MSISSLLISIISDLIEMTEFAVGLAEGLLSNPRRNGVGDGLFEELVLQWRPQTSLALKLYLCFLMVIHWVLEL